MKQLFLKPLVFLFVFSLFSCGPIEEFNDALDLDDSVSLEESETTDEPDDTEESEESEASEASEEPEATEENEQSEEPATPSFAMTAMINGINFQANTPFGTNEFADTNIFSRYPIEDFVLLQGRSGGLFGNKEINIWLKREDIAVGIYEVSIDDLGLTPPTHYVEYTDNTNNVEEYTFEGNIEITEVDTALKIVKGTFSFTTVGETLEVKYTVTDGSFHYTYE